jgi:hypothetical protein
MYGCRPPKESPKEYKVHTTPAEHSLAERKSKRPARSIYKISLTSANSFRHGGAARQGTVFQTLGIF